MQFNGEKIMFKIFITNKYIHVLDVCDLYININIMEKYGMRGM